MTVCIAALAEGGRKAVLVSDKMISTPGLLPYQTDGSGDKIFKINECVHGMWSGGVTDVAGILSIFREKIGTRPLTVQQLAEELRESHLEYLLGVLEREHIIGRGIPSKAAFYGDATIALTLDARQSIQNVLLTYNLNSNTQFMVCGKDGDGIYKICVLNTNPRLMLSFANDSYSQIGSGQTHAQFSIVHSSYKPSLPVSKVEKMLRVAKRRAEKDPYVGKETDVVICN